MKREILILFLIVTGPILSSNIFGQEIKLISYYPAPFGSYKQLTVGSGVKQPKSDNITTKIRIGVTDDTYDPIKETYIPAVLEIGGIGVVPNDGTIEYPDSVGLCVKGKIAIAGIGSSDDQPSIVGYKPLKDNLEPYTGPAILGTGSEIGTKGEGTKTGVEGYVKCTTATATGEALPSLLNSPSHVGVRGIATSKTSGYTLSTNSIAGIYGLAEVSNEDSTQTLAYGVYGQVENQKSPDDNNLSAIGVHGRASGLNSIGVLGYGQNYGIYGQSPGNAGYFDGNVEVTKRAKLTIPSIPVLTRGTVDKYYSERGLSPKDGDLIYFTDLDPNIGGLRIYIGSQWKKT